MCPHCRKSAVYYPTKSIFHMPEMKVKCDNCNYKFDREPGYFLGAMYISYAIAVFLGITTFVLQNKFSFELLVCFIIQK